MQNSTRLRPTRPLAARVVRRLLTTHSRLAAVRVQTGPLLAAAAGCGVGLCCACVGQPAEAASSSRFEDDYELWQAGKGVDAIKSVESCADVLGAFGKVAALEV